MNYKQSEMVDTYVGLGDSQVKLSCESRLAAASAWSGPCLVSGTGARVSLRPAVACLRI